MSEKELLKKSSVCAFLHKKSHSDVKKIWQKRYFILKDDVLLYFKTNSDFYHPLGILYLYQGTLNRSPVYKKRDYTFVVHSQGKRYHLAADNEKQLNEWCDALETAIKKANKDFLQEVSDLQNESQENRMKIVTISKNLEISDKSFVDMIQSLRTLMTTLESFNNSKTLSKNRSFTTFEKNDELKFGDSSSGEIFKNANDKITKIRDQINKYSTLLQDSSKNYKMVRDIRIKIGLQRSQVEALNQKLSQDKLKRLDFIDVFVTYEDEIMSLLHEGLSQVRKMQSLQQNEVKNTSNVEQDEKSSEEIELVKQRIAKNEEELKELNYHKKVLLKELKSLRDAK